MTKKKKGRVSTSMRKNARLAVRRQSRRRTERLVIRRELHRRLSRRGRGSFVAHGIFRHAIPTNYTHVHTHTLVSEDPDSRGADHVCEILTNDRSEDDDNDAEESVAGETVHLRTSPGLETCSSDLCVSMTCRHVTQVVSCFNGEIRTLPLIIHASESKGHDGLRLSIRLHSGLGNGFANDLLWAE